MELTFDEFALTIEAKDLAVPFGLSDDDLFLAVRDNLLGLLNDPGTSIIHFGYAPDNTADGNDELLLDGFYYRIIGYEKNLGIDLESSTSEVLHAFKYLVENYKPFWSTIIFETGDVKEEVTIELLYQDVF